MSDSVLAVPVWWATWFGAASAAIVLFAWLVYTLYVYPEYLSPLRSLPGPRDHNLFLGQHLNQYRTGDPEEPYMAWMRTWPTAPLIRYYDVFGGDAVLINSPQAYREVMSDLCYSFVRSKPFRRLIGDIIGEGLVFAEGHAHRAQRRALGGLFINSNVRGHLPMFNRKALCVVDEVDQALQKAGQVEIKELFAKATLDVIGIFAFGIDFGHFTSKTEFTECYTAMFDLTPGGMLLAAINLVVPVRWLPLADNNRFMHASVRLRQIMTDITDRRIAEVRQARAGGKDLHSRDMLTYMIETKYLADSNRDPWSKGELVEQALNFLATGHETTAGALTFALHLVAKHPRVVCKLRAAARAASISVAADADGSTPSFSQVDGLPYLDHILKECLRLLPPVAGIPRVATHDLVVAGQLIPKGTTLMPVPAVIHHNPAIWGPDADEFRPERWDRPAGGAVDAEHYAWVGFGHGPRACIGRALAALNVKTVLLQLLLRFDFSPADGGKIPVVNPSGQLRPRGDVWMEVRRAAAVGGDGEA